MALFGFRAKEREKAMTAKQGATFSLAGMTQSDGMIPIATLIGTLGLIEDDMELEAALGELVQYAGMIPDAPEMLNEAFGAVEALGAIMRHPRIINIRRGTQSRGYAALERMRAIVTGGTHFQIQNAQRPNVFLFARFAHAAAGALDITDLRPSLPAQGTVATANGPLHLIQTRTFLKVGAWENADIDVRVARVSNSQYTAPAGQPIPAGLPIEMFAPHAYRNGIKPPYIRGLEQADSNTVITLTSTADAAVTYGVVFEFVMEAFLGGECGRIKPSILRGPMSILPSLQSQLRRM